MLIVIVIAMWLTDVFLIDFGQQWTSVAQRKEHHYLNRQTQNE